MRLHHAFPSIFGSQPSLQLAGATVSSTAAIGTVVGTLSVQNGKGSYIYALTSNPGGLFSITGNQLKVAAALSPGSDPITIQATGSGSPKSSFLITVTNGAFVPTFELYGF